MVETQKRNSLLRPKTYQVRANATIALPEVWDEHIVATLEHMITNARRAQGVLCAQYEPDANVPQDDVRAAILLQGQMSAAIQDLIVTYAWTQQAYTQTMSGQRYSEHTLQHAQEEPQAAFKAPPNTPFKAFPKKYN